jgi:hypothetical protein
LICGVGAFARRNRLKLVSGGIVLVVIGLVALFSSGGGYSGPSCQANSSGCDFAANGVWIPLWYYSSLQQAQGITTAPTTAGPQPTESEEEGDGATPSEAADAEDAADSDDSGGDDG